MHAHEYKRENYACGANYASLNFNDILIKNLKFNNFKRVNLNDRQTGLEEKHYLTIPKKKRMIPVPCNVNNTIVFDATATDAIVILKSAILDQLKKQYNDYFYDFHQYRVFKKLQTAFIADAKIHKQNLPLKSLNYR